MLGSQLGGLQRHISSLLVALLTHSRPVHRAEGGPCKHKASTYDGGAGPI